MDGKTGSGGPGVGVRVEGPSLLDSSWQLLDRNEHGLIVEDDAPVGDAARNELQGAADGTSQEGEKETSNGVVKEEMKCEIGERVEHGKYGCGVVRWVGEVGGEMMAGIELVRDLLPVTSVSSLITEHISTGGLQSGMWGWVSARLQATPLPLSRGPRSVLPNL